jgi:hypothetical protein
MVTSRSSKARLKHWLARIRCAQSSGAAIRERGLGALVLRIRTVVYDLGWLGVKG